MVGIVVLVVVMLMTLFIGYVLGLIGHILGLASPRARGAKSLAVWVLVVSLVSLALSIVPYALSGVFGGAQGIMAMMGGAGNPMLAGGQGGFGGPAVAEMPGWVTTANLVLGGINNLLTVAALFLFGFYVRAIALCLGADSLRRSVKGWMIMVGVAVVLGLVVALAFFVMFKDMLLNAGAGAAPPPPGGLPPGMSPGNLFAFAGVACLFGVVVLALLVWYIIMLAQARTAISARAFQR
jgi:hypothetical protein